MSIKEDRLNAVEKDFVMQAKTAFGDNLKSIILYGSILTENYNPLSSDINLLIILNQADPERIIVLGKYAAKTLQSNSITPTILSHNEFISSADIFPMEYFDIKELHKTLYGDDVFQNLTISDVTRFDSDTSKETLFLQRYETLYRLYNEFIPLRLKKMIVHYLKEKEISIPLPPEPIITKKGDELDVFVTMIRQYSDYEELDKPVV